MPFWRPRSQLVGDVAVPESAPIFITAVVECESESEPEPESSRRALVRAEGTLDLWCSWSFVSIPATEGCPYKRLVTGAESELGRLLVELKNERRPWFEAHSFSLIRCQSPDESLNAAYPDPAYKLYGSPIV